MKTSRSLPTPGGGSALDSRVLRCQWAGARIAAKSDDVGDGAIGAKLSPKDFHFPAGCAHWGDTGDVGSEVSEGDLASQRP